MKKTTNEYVMIHVTYDNKKIMEQTVNELLDLKLIACSQISNIDSKYWWQGKKETAREYSAVLKTKNTLVNQVYNVVKKLHNYEVPQFLVIPIVNGSKEYLDWIRKETTEG